MAAIPTLDAHRIEQLVRKHQSHLRGFLTYLGCPRPMLDDLIQETFLSVLSSRFEERGEHSTAAFLRTVARNLFLKAMRRERRQPRSMDLAGVEKAWVEFQGEDRGNSYLTALRDCLRRVGGRPAKVLEMRYRGNMRRAAIASHLGLSESGIKSILVRTRRKLRECVERKRA
jgi:RNA polymerase sigma-70 factor, ECF subfamily